MRRRALAIVAIAVLIIVPSVILIGQQLGDDSSTVKIPDTPNHTSVKKLGISLSWPDGWKLTRKAGDLKLISDDRTSAFLVSSPAPVNQILGVYTSAVKALSATYRKGKLRVLKRAATVDGRAAATAVITGTTKKGIKQSVVISVVRGRKRVYVVETILPTGGGRPGDVALISQTLRLTR